MTEKVALDGVVKNGELVAAHGDNSIPSGRTIGSSSAVAKHMAAIMRELNLDLDDPNFVETPERVAKMYLEMFHGLREGAEPKVTTFPNDEGYHHMVIEKGDPLLLDVRPPLRAVLRSRSHRLHSRVETIVGLSKLPRILEFYAKRPQLQERLTEQVAEFLWSQARAPGRDGRHRGPPPLRRDAGGQEEPAR